MTKIIYTPGVCNIGPEEIAKRKMVGWIGLSATVVVIVLLLVLPIPYLWRLIVILPSFASAAGFVQAYFGFCVAFAQEGISNFGPLGTADTVTDEQSKIKDRKRTVQLYLYMAVIAILVTAFTLLL